MPLGPAAPQWTLQLDRNEGTSEPYVARLFLGLMELRDEAMGFVRTMGTEQARRQFDKTFEPVLNSLDVVREANKEMQKLVGEHRAKVVDGSIVSFQRNAVNIHESITRPLGAEFEKFLNAGVRAMKGVQGVLEPFRLPIGFLFQSQRNFEKGLAECEAGGHALLAAYYKAARASWSDQFFNRRNAMEHEGWQLVPVIYRPVDGKPTMIEPVVDGLPVTDFADRMARRIIAFVEEVTAHAFATLLPAPVVIVEDPPEKRDPDRATRFRIHLAGSDPPPWVLTYDDQGFR